MCTWSSLNDLASKNNRRTFFSLALILDWSLKWLSLKRSPFILFQLCFSKCACFIKRGVYAGEQQTEVVELQGKNVKRMQIFLPVQLIAVHVWSQILVIWIFHSCTWTFLHAWSFFFLISTIVFCLWAPHGSLRSIRWCFNRCMLNSTAIGWFIGSMEQMG